ncbi:hypothetical protein DFQ28_011588 [Apophysomyces sp. BC1034]|nr:hypothetical protein DFQ30_008795 [Apophysomyces sp. BC1015]KAG0181712.1 hypothetical protein DFQ29_007378 [Apophysomyces sp. BC1021]KAG0191546.1 hypothetical protein DFQ28_011588 [Apophysomyces sp. BC1034]
MLRVYSILYLQQLWTVRSDPYEAIAREILVPEDIEQNLQEAELFFDEPMTREISVSPSIPAQEEIDQVILVKENESVKEIQLVQQDDQDEKVKSEVEVEAEEEHQDQEEEEESTEEEELSSIDIPATIEEEKEEEEQQEEVQEEEQEPEQEEEEVAVKEETVEEAVVEVKELPVIEETKEPLEQDDRRDSKFLPSEEEGPFSLSSIAEEDYSPPRSASLELNRPSQHSEKVAHRHSMFVDPTESIVSSSGSMPPTPTSVHADSFKTETQSAVRRETLKERRKSLTTKVKRVFSVHRRKASV